MRHPTFQGTFSAGKIGNGRSWNKALHFRHKIPLFHADSLYSVSGYTYRTDFSARVDKVMGVLRLEKADRNGTQAKHVRNLVRTSGEVAGHIIGAQFGGTGDGINMVSMAKVVNEYWNGEYGKVENLWVSALKAGSTVSVVIELYYEADRRPCGIDIRYCIDGNYHQKYIENP